MQSYTAFFVLILFTEICLGITNFEREVLDEHNKLRASHNAEGLELDDKLSKKAKDAAEKAAKKGSFDNMLPGQSAFVSCESFKREVSGKEVADAWYGEVCNPDFDINNPDNEKASGFTQLVWKDTRRLGIGKAKGRDNKGRTCVYVVCAYRPPGNLVGFFEENVFKGTFDKEHDCKDGNYDPGNDDSEEQENDEGDSIDKEDEDQSGEEEGEEEDVEKDLKIEGAVKDETEKIHQKTKQSNKFISSKKSE